MSKSGVVSGRSGITLWWCVLACLGLCAMALAFLPLLRITTILSLNYNEGWNAYRAQMAAEGIPLYAARPSDSITNYPFLSYHIVGLLSRITGNVTLAGRGIALASLLAIATLVAVIARKFTESWRMGMFAGLCFFVWLGTYSPDRLAMNDPHLLGMALTTFALYAYLHTPGRIGWLVVSAIAFTAAIFTKNNLIGFPAAVALDLLLRYRLRDFLVWAITSIVAACTLLLLTFHLDGDYFLNHLSMNRPYDVVGGVAANLDFVSWFYVPLGIVFGWFISGERSNHRTFFTILLLVSSFIEAVFAFGNGVGSNIFYDVIAAVALVTAIALSDLERAVSQQRWGKAIFATLVILPALTGIMHVPRQVYSDLKAWHQLPGLQVDMAQGIDMLDHVDGPVLCENILLCFEAHKPMGPDINFIQGQIRLGRISEDILLSQIKDLYYGAVEIGEEPSRPPISSESEQLRFSPAFMTTLYKHYRPSLQTAHFSIFIPR